MPKDLRSFLRDVIAARPGEIKQVSDPVDPRFGATAVAERFARDHQYPALYFEKVGRSGIPVVLNLTATYDRLALAFGTDVANLVPTFGQLMTRPLAAREVRRDEAPVKELTLTGDDIDLGTLPLLTHNELDGGPYITSGIGIMRDPDTGRINAGIYRHQVHSRNELGVWFIDTHHGAYIHRSYEQRGQAAPIAIAIGHHPAVVMGAVCRLPGIGGEFEAAGALLGESVEITRAETCGPAGACSRRDRDRRRSHPSRAKTRRAVRRMAGTLHRGGAEAGHSRDGDHDAARCPLLRHLLREPRAPRFSAACRGWAASIAM